MTTAKDIFQVASNPEIRQIFAKQFYTVSGTDAANLVDDQGGNYHGNGSKEQHVRSVHFEHFEQEH